MHRLKSRCSSKSAPVAAPRWECRWSGDVAPLFRPLSARTAPTAAALGRAGRTGSPPPAATLGDLRRKLAPPNRPTDPAVAGLDRAGQSPIELGCGTLARSLLQRPGGLDADSLGTQASRASFNAHALGGHGSRQAPVGRGPVGRQRNASYDRYSKSSHGVSSRVYPS